MTATSLSTVEVAVRRLIGRRDTLGSLRLERTQVRRFRALCNAGLDSGFEPDSAGGDDVPPLYLAAIFGWSEGMPDTRDRTDGLSTADAIGVDLRDVEVLGAGQSVEIRRKLRVDETVTAVRIIESVLRKRGRSGDFLLITVGRSITDMTGAEVCQCRETFIIRGCS